MLVLRVGVLGPTSLSVGTRVGMLFENFHRAPHARRGTRCPSDGRRMRPYGVLKHFLPSLRHLGRYQDADWRNLGGLNETHLDATRGQGAIRTPSGRHPDAIRTVCTAPTEGDLPQSLQVLEHMLVLFAPASVGKKDPTLLHILRCLGG